MPETSFYRRKEDGELCIIGFNGVEMHWSAARRPLPFERAARASTTQYRAANIRTH